jgi:hypothetical protein
MLSGVKRFIAFVFFDSLKSSGVIPQSYPIRQLKGRGGELGVFIDTQHQIPYTS